MAELRDSLYKKVLYIDLKEQRGTASVADVRLAYQTDEFIDNVVGWRFRTQGEVGWYDFVLNMAEISDFIKATKDWLALPISELGKTFFSGEWSWEAERGTEFKIEFGPCFETPSKTDWFIVRLQIASEVLRKEERFHVDHSCLAIFVDGLSEKG